MDAIVPGERDQFLWDDQVRGFGLKVTSLGARIYVLQYRMGGRGTPTRRYTIGKHGSPWTPDGARKEAQRLLEHVRRGDDPADVARERKRALIELGFDQYLDRFLRLYGKVNWRPGTYASAESNLLRFVKPVLGRKPMPSIRRADIVAIFDALPAGKPALPRNVFAHARKVFSWAVERGDIERSPFEGMKSPPTVASRERVLNDQELGLVRDGTRKLDRSVGALVRLLMLTGQRRDEVAGMSWNELDRSASLWTIPGKRTKNGETHTVPLVAEVRSELDAIGGKKWPRKGFVFTTNHRTPFSGFSKAKAQLDMQVAKLVEERELDIEIEPWRLHDLRRTLATGMQRLNVRFEVTEAILNHVSGSRAGVAGVYQRHDWASEKRAAMEAWTAHVKRTSTRPVSRRASANARAQTLR